MTTTFELLMLSAMYENGGNTTHRFLDGHPQLFVYPFESQLGTRLVQDRLSSTFPTKYRWPVFGLTSSATLDYASIIDEECKVRTRTSHVSKFRHIELDLCDDERRQRYEEIIAARGRSRANNVAAFFEATFDVWKNRQRSGRERCYVGYSPIVVVDTIDILRDFPRAHLLHVVRNPWSAYGDTKKRAVPMSLADYMLGWTLSQYHALLFGRLYPKRVHVVRFEDVLADPQASLGAILNKMGLETAPSLAQCTFNGEPLPEVTPWGTIRSATPEANRAAAAGLSENERLEIRERAQPYLAPFDYEGFA